jgi:hypothetical protein
VTVPELRLLQHYAHEAGTVLEIGTYLGFTAIGMALAGADVTSVDPHTPDISAALDTGSPYEDTWATFLANARRHGFDPTRIASWHHGGPGAILAFRERIEDSPLTNYQAGLVFIDGDHAHPVPMRDARIALEHLRAPGYVAFHDVTPIWMDVWLATRALERSGELVKVAQERYLAVYQAARYQTRASSVSGRSSTPTQA